MTYIQGAFCMEKLLNAFIAWIVAATGMVAPPPPDVSFVSQAQLIEMLYGDSADAKGPKVKALYAQNIGRIYLSRDWNADDVLQRSQVLHELVHHVQKFNKVPAPCLNAYEKQAYELQIRWLHEQGVRNPYAALDINEFTILLLTRCSWD